MQRCPNEDDVICTGQEIDQSVAVTSDNREVSQFLNEPSYPGQVTFLLALSRAVPPHTAKMDTAEWAVRPCSNTDCHERQAETENETIERGEGKLGWAKSLFIFIFE